MGVNTEKGGCCRQRALSYARGRLASATGLGNSARGGASGRRGFRPPPQLLPWETAARRRKEPRTCRSRLGEWDPWRPWRSRSPGTGAGPCGPRCHPPPSSPRCSRCWCLGLACSCCSRLWRPRASRCGPRPCATGKVSRAGPGPGCQPFSSDLARPWALASQHPRHPVSVRIIILPTWRTSPIFHVFVCAEPHLRHHCNASLSRFVPFPVAIRLVKAPISIRSK